LKKHITSCSAKSSAVTVRVRSSYISDGDVLEIDNIVVHENFDKYVYFNDIALMKVRIFAEQASYAHFIGLSRARVCKVVTFIKLVAKESCGVWRKVASHRTPGEGKRRTPGWNSLCRDWLETGKIRIPRVTSVYFQAHAIHKRPCAKKNAI